MKRRGQRQSGAALIVALWTVLILSLLIGGSVVIEQVFALPGLGSQLLSAVSQRDLMIVQSVVMFLAATVLLINFVVDLSYAWIDPRLRTEVEP